MNQLEALSRFIPPIVALIGIAWMAVAINHFSNATGRPFYGLAGFHYSTPEWGFKYLAGGERIERMAVTIPAGATLAALLICAVTSSVDLRRSSGGSIAFVWVLHLISGFALSLVALWCWLNILGVFV